MKITCLDDGIYIESEEGIENIYWSRTALKRCFAKKYKNKFVYAKADSRGDGASEEFKFRDAYEVSGFNYDSFIALLEAGKYMLTCELGNIIAVEMREKRTITEPVLEFVNMTSHFYLQTT